MPRKKNEEYYRDPRRIVAWRCFQDDRREKWTKCSGCQAENEECFQDASKGTVFLVIP